MDAQEKQQILKELGDLPEEIYDELVEDFKTLALQQISELKVCIEQSTYEDAAKLAHSIKGSAGNLRLNELFELARSLEYAFKEEQNSSEILPLLEKLQFLLDQF